MNEQGRLGASRFVLMGAVAVALAVAACTEELVIAGSDSSTGLESKEAGTGFAAASSQGLDAGIPLLPPYSPTDASTLFDVDLVDDSDPLACMSMNTTSCTPDCRGATACNITCAASHGCLLDCRGSVECRVSCQSGGHCDVDCREGGNCESVRCESGSTCELKCDLGQACAFQQCAYPIDCGDQGDHTLVVCNEPCP